jgi:osmoprotectant transport system permease protein
MNFFHFLWQNHEQVLELTLEHLWLVGISTLLAVLVGIPLGILSAHRPFWNKPVLGTANIIQTIPSLALFGEAWASPAVSSCFRWNCPSP